MKISNGPNFESSNFKEMDKIKRAKYEERAKGARAGGGPAATKVDYERYTSQGIAFSAIERQKQKEQQKAKYMNETIRNFVNGLSYPNGLANQEIHFIHGNYFCRTADCYLPAELGIAKFSFKRGVIKKYSTFLDPSKSTISFAQIRTHAVY